MAATRIWLEPPRPPTARAAGRIVAKGTSRTVHAIADLGDHIAIAHHEGLASSPGGISIRRWRDLGVVRSTTHAFGPLDTTGAYWIVSGPLWRGRHACARLVEPSTLATVDTLPVAPPFVRIDARRIIAHTPPTQYTEDRTAAITYEVDPGELAASGIALPVRGALVEVDLEHRTVRVLVEASRYDDFTTAALSPDRRVVYAASSFGRVVAVRIADSVVLWERPAVRNVVQFSLHALALSADGARLAVGGSGNDRDVLLLDTATGATQQELVLCRMLEQARITSKPNVRIEALAFHPTGWLAASTNAGVIAELHVDGNISAFRASGAGIDAFTFVEAGRTLVVGGREPQLRVWPIDV